MILIALLLIPVLASAAIGLARKRGLMEFIHATASVATLATGGVVVARIWAGMEVVQWNLLRADALSAFMIAIVTFVGAVAGIYAVGYMRLEFDNDHMAQVRSFYALFQLFLFTMLLAVTTD